MHAMFRQKRLLSVTLLLGIAGCATNALRVDNARRVGEEGQFVAASARHFLGRVDMARREANIELIAADPACYAEPAKVRVSPRIDAPGDRGWLCVPPGWAPDESRAFSLQPVTPQLAVTLDLLGSLTAYTEALADIVDTKPSEPLKPLLDALDTAHAVQEALQAVRGRAGGPIPADDDARLTAVTGFVGFLTELSDEADKVRRLRQVMIKHPEGATPLTAALRDDLETWDVSRSGDELVRKDVADAIVGRTMRRSNVSVGERRESVERSYAAADANAASRKLYPALETLLDELDAADRDLRRTVVEHPNLSPQERRKTAELNRQRVVRALRGIAAIVTAFRG